MDRKPNAHAQAMAKERWKGIDKAARSAYMSALSKKRWDKVDKKSKSVSNIKEPLHPSAPIL